MSSGRCFLYLMKKLRCYYSILFAKSKSKTCGSEMRKIIVYIATSADGFIARKDGAVDWLDRPRTAGDYGMGKFWKSIDTILLGRKTYDLALRFQKEGKAIPSMGDIKHYAFSR